MKQYIPNALTLLNLFCGSIAVILAVNNNFVGAALFVFLGVFFDFFDGFAARKLNVQSELGVQLDSLADMVTSGVVPGIIMYKLLALTLGSNEAFTASSEWSTTMYWTSFKVLPLPFLGLGITLASAYRLAKFNIDEDQQTYFKGLPTPANTLLIVSLPLILEFQNSDLINSIIVNKWFLIVLTALSCYLLNSNIKLFALKFKDWGFKANATRYIFIMLCIILLIVLQFAAIPIIILLYIGMSVLDNVASKLK
ncbi:CDP-alcohol phosphatidyltransferase family protein [Mariniflexile gromovii]|uniref:CDP-alcohol phosphatidyltransferase family protein n=1 Tax=Mariniflexile gromovii TaxID=362523 RepID=A0ABS4BVD3_9FLAO|nr:CDP-alcohol phosphatidyltransferase family protein [Mariniflexile gromovii]MBP0904546.1 CDP-alcohol phosphatidyltransferase family protein [Mariniflexile gromovii]